MNVYVSKKIGKITFYLRSYAINIYGVELIFTQDKTQAYNYKQHILVAKSDANEIDGEVVEEA